MKVMAFNGSPRKKKWNTVTLLENALEGASSAGAETELIHLYDLQFSGCLSCFSCKRLDRKENGVCAVRDALSPVLERIRKADALIIGTPVYCGAETASTRAFLERLLYSNLNYGKNYKSLASHFPRKINTAMIYTMNATDEMITYFGFDRLFATMKMFMEVIFGTCELLLSKDTLQFRNYDEYDVALFDKVKKAKRHAEVFPEDCKHAFELGIRMAAGDTP